MSPAACRDCRHFHADEPGGATGQCRRHPPVVLGAQPPHRLTLRGETWWPAVEPEDWCGEFGRRDGGGAEDG